MQRSEAVIPDSLMFDFVLKRKKFRSFFSLSPLFENVSILFDFIISSGIYSRIFKIFFSGTAFFRLMDSILFCFLYSMLLFSLAFFCLVFCWIEFSFTNWQWDRDSNNKISENEKTKLTNLQSILWRKCTKKKRKNCWRR